MNSCHALRRPPTPSRRTLALTFLGASQQAKGAKLVALHGSPDVAQGKFERRVADELTSRGVIDVLRRGVKDLGVHFDHDARCPACFWTPLPGHGAGRGATPPSSST